MTRRGRCRCGKVLVFAWTTQGYKTRCAACHAIVRLRLDEPPPPPPLPPHRPPTRKTDYHAPPLHDGSDATRPLDLSDLSEHESSAPVALAELEVFADPSPPSRRLLWLLVAGLTVFLAAVGTTLALLI